jgi:phosphoribosyl 1,2-cyclic phosphate phosphodiesterase
MSQLRITFLGTGTSQGVPRIGCECSVCQSDDPKDKRTRCSVYLQTDEGSWVVDTGTDFRAQCLREGVREIDAVLYTHSHTDHILGLDDLRPFCAQGRAMPLFGSQETLSQLERMFDFMFSPEKRIPGYMHPDSRVVRGEFELGPLHVTPLPLPHGRTESFGYLFKRGGELLFAYLTDCHAVPDKVVEAVAGVRHMVVDALRRRPHPTHMNVDEALEVISKVRPGRAWLTHLCHEHKHAELEAELPEGVGIAYDGLVLDV